MTYGNYPDLKNVKKVLVVKMRHLGDVLLSSPLFSHLKKALPQAQIDALIYTDTLPMLEGHPAISNFLLYNRGNKKLSFFARLGGEISLYSQVRKGGYDLVINLTEGDRGALAALFSSAPIRVGFDPEGSGFRAKRRIYTHLVKNCKTPRHTVEKNLDALRRIGLFPVPEERDLTMHIPESALARFDRMGDYIVIHPVSRWRFKCPPPSTIAALIRQLHKRGEKIVLTAGPDKEEGKMIEEILQLASDVEVVNFAGKLSLKELAALIQLSRCLICVDSVPLHMASALKTPVVVLFGPSCDQNWGPWMHPQSRIVAQPFSCRPCHRDGCGGSKMSDCLYTLPTSSILAAFDSLIGTGELQKI
jgi:heptosyltransferase III